jgi:hypothetical protein
MIAENKFESIRFPGNNARTVDQPDAKILIGSFDNSMRHVPDSSLTPWGLGN